ncbi:MAG: transposon-encoded TnpW family protein [Oscillospiraceae bacterium]|nr:transposon-encoded TnpW family protein [Oscillospiraceae bacterium]
MTNNLSKTISSAAVPNTPPSMVKKIDNITYRVWVHFSETSTETMEDKIKRMLQSEVRQIMESE